eukprot:5670-Heterococcus_DN1.PRE.1
MFQQQSVRTLRLRRLHAPMPEIKVRLQLPERELVGAIHRLAGEGNDWSDFEQELAAKEGEVHIKKSTRRHIIDKERLEHDVKTAMQLLGCSKYDVSIWLTTDKTVRRLNAQYRGVDRSTDILSFGMCEHLLHSESAQSTSKFQWSNRQNMLRATVDCQTPGQLPTPRHVAEMDLGEMMISLAYVERQIQRDKDEFEATAAKGQPLEEERGVSGAMAKCFSLQDRLSLLCVHGLLHLLGYDHETDEDYEEMVSKEEVVLHALSSSSSASDSSSRGSSTTTEQLPLQHATVLQDLDADLSAFGNFTALDVDNTGAFAVLGSRKALVLVQLESPQQPVQTLHYQSRYDVTCLRWSPLTSGALASTSNSSVLIWDVDSADSLVATLRKHRRPVTDISWSPLHSSVLASS